MAHFAKLDGNNIVVHVSVVDNQNLLDENGVEREELGVKYLQSIHGEGTRWAQTSYNAKFRKHYAGLGYRYDEQLDAFVPPQPFASWTLNTDTCVWEPPVPRPTDNSYRWNEELKTWQLKQYWV
jgi:hypothetical protein